MAGHLPCMGQSNQDLLSSPRVLLLMAVMWLGGSCMLVMGILVIMRLANESTGPDSPTVMGLNYTSAFILVVLAVVTHLSVLLVFMMLMHIEKNSERSSEIPSSASSSGITSLSIVMAVKDVDNPPSYEALMANETPPPAFHSLLSVTGDQRGHRISNESLELDVDSLERRYEPQRLPINATETLNGQNDPLSVLRESKLNFKKLCKANLNEEICKSLTGFCADDRTKETRVVESESKAGFTSSNGFCNAFSLQRNTLDRSVKLIEEGKSSSITSVNSSSDENVTTYETMPLIQALYRVGETAAYLTSPRINFRMNCNEPIQPQAFDRRNDDLSDLLSSCDTEVSASGRHQQPKVPHKSTGLYEYQPASAKLTENLEYDVQPSIELNDFPVEEIVCS